VIAASLNVYLRGHLQQAGMIAAFIIMVIVFSVLSPVFFTYPNFINIANQVAIISVLAFGMTMVMLTGGIDLSVGSMLSLSGVVCAMLLNAGHGVALAVFAPLFIGLLFGGVNGFVSIRWGIHPFLVTLGMLSIERGLSLVLSDGRTIYIDSHFFLAVTAQGFVGPVPMLFVWTLVFFVLTWTVMNLTTFGRRVRAVGGNITAARQAGLATGWIITRVFMVSGCLAAFSGLMMAGRLSSGLPTVGVGMELDAIAAAVLGGTGFKGEGGSLVGTLFGALIMGTIINGLTILGVNPYIQEIAKGVIIILAVLLVRIRH
jgi:ribose/xylose/arabinose/galactoside ABC-type transport system permease subunit